MMTNDTPRLAAAGLILLAATTGSAAPLAPENLAAVPLSDSEIQVQWVDHADNETSYVIFRRGPDDVDWQELIDDLPPDSESFVDSNLPADTTFLYRVSVRAPDGESFGGFARAVTDDKPHGLRTLIFQDGYNAYEETRDVGIAQTRPADSNLAPHVWIDNNSASDDNQALLQFSDLIGPGALQVNPGAEIARATLRLVLGDVSSGASPEAVYFHRMLVPWDEDASWSSDYWTGSGNGVNRNNVDAALEPDAHTTFDTPERTYEIDVTGAVQAWADGQANNGWLIRTNSTNGYAYYTSHGVLDNRPSLIVEYDTDPENEWPVATVNGPLEGTETEDNTTVLDISVEDPDGDPLSVTFYGRQWPMVQDDFSVVVLPDSQYYPARSRGGLPAMFDSQTEWIVENREAWNIAFVLHVGDIVNNGDVLSNGGENSIEWAYASRSMYKLEDPDTTGLEDGIPYTITVGNHDQQPRGDPDGRSEFYNRYFGVEHFADKHYYGGHFGEDNDNHYELYNIGPLRFISISLEFNGPTASRNAAELLQWADELLKRHPDRRGIITTHFLMSAGNPGPWSPDGAAIYETLKDNPNLHLMFGGHVRGEGWRTDTYQGNTVHSFLQDYQFYENGGSGFMRILTFSPRHGEIRARTYSPWLDVYETDWNSEFVIPYPMGAPEAPEFVELATYEVASGQQVTHSIVDLEAGQDYEWYAVISDGRKTTTLDPVTFTARHPYSEWALDHFGEAGPESGRLSDPDRDGYANVLEFIFDSDPGDDSPHAHMPTVVVADGLSHVRYTRIKDPKLTWSYEVSSDLGTWNLARESGILIDERVVDNGNGTETVHLELENPAEALFWRIVVD